jgi:hypothetical protein
VRDFVDPLWFGLRRHPWRYALASGGVYGALWTAVESMSYFFTEQRIRGLIGIEWIVLVAAVAGLLAVAQRRSISLRLGAGNTTLRIYFGDLFAAPGHKVIPTNEYFDSALGQHVAPGSIHGRVIERYFSGHPHSFDALVDASLKTVSCETVPRTSGRTSRYPIGTTAVVPVKDGTLFLVAVAHTELTTLKAHASTLDLWIALEGLWEKVRVEANGQQVTVPLIGGGLAGVPLPCTALVQCIITSLHAASAKSRVTETVQIVLHESLFPQIDLEVVRQQWS